MKEPWIESMLAEAEDDAERETLRRTWDRLGALESPGPSLPAPVAPRSRSTVGRWLAVAAVLAGLALGGWAVRSRLMPRESAVAETPRLAPWRLATVETLAARVGEREAARTLIEMSVTDRSVGVRLAAIEALHGFDLDPEDTGRLLGHLHDSDSTLERIRLIEHFVDHRVDAALPGIESLDRDPRTDELVRETAQWACGRLRNRSSS